MDDKFQVKNVEEWEKYVLLNTKDGYSAIVVYVSILAMEDLQKSLPNNEDREKELKSIAYDLGCYGMSGFQANAVAQAVANFSVFGEEFKKVCIENGLFSFSDESQEQSAA